MKKLISIALFISFALMLSTVSYANDSELNIKMSADSSNLQSNSIIELNIELSDFVNVNTEKPMAAEGTLVYEEDLFESVEAIGKNGWVASLREKRFLLDAGSASENIIATFRFKLKDSAKSDSKVITFNVKNFSLTNDAGVDYENITLGETKVTYNANTNNQTSTEENSDALMQNDEKDNTTEKTNQSTEDTKPTTEKTNQGTEDTKPTTEKTSQDTKDTKETTEKNKMEIPYERLEVINQEGKNETTNNNADNTSKIEKVADLTIKETKELPYAGENQALIITFTIMTAIAIFAFIRYRFIEIKAK